MKNGGRQGLTPWQREVRSGGAVVLRYSIERVAFEGCEEVNLFLSEFFEALRRFCEEEGVRCAEAYGALPRGERAGFSPLFIKGEAVALEGGEGRFGFVYRMSAADKRGVLREREEKVVFEEGDRGQWTHPHERSE